MQDTSRAQQCSKVVDCWENDVYDNSKCESDQHCGEWVENGQKLHGCILSKMCDTTGIWTGNSVEFKCPSQTGRETPVQQPIEYYTK